VAERATRESVRQQAIAGQRRDRFAINLVIGGTPASQIVVVHAGQIVMHQRIGVDHFDCAGEAQRGLSRAPTASQAASARIGRRRFPRPAGYNASPRAAGSRDHPIPRHCAPVRFRSTPRAPLDNSRRRKDGRHQMLPAMLPDSTGGRGRSPGCSSVSHSSMLACSSPRHGDARGLPLTEHPRSGCTLRRVATPRSQDM